jgi:hypothetical protein
LYLLIGLVDDRVLYRLARFAYLLAVNAYRNGCIPHYEYNPSKSKLLSNVRLSIDADGRTVVQDICTWRKEFIPSLFRVGSMMTRKILSFRTAVEDSFGVMIRIARRRAK